MLMAAQEDITPDELAIYKQNTFSSPTTQTLLPGKGYKKQIHYNHKTLTNRRKKEIRSGDRRKIKNVI